MINKSWLSLLTVGLCLVLATPTFTFAGTPTNRSNRRIIFRPPPNDRKPDGAIGAGSRGTGECFTDSNARTFLEALVPPESIALTSAERPAFWVYIPPNTASKMALSLVEEGGTPRSPIFYPVPELGGFVRLQAPLDTPPLEVGKTYRWAVVLLCGDRPNPNDAAVTGLVHRVDLPAPPGGTTWERAYWYSERGIWHDALEALILAWRENPDERDLGTLWTDFLRSAGLESLAARTRPF
jgi:Domain of Unknown Function (DUF928)